VEAEFLLELDQELEQHTIAPLGLGDQPRHLPEVGLLLACRRAQGRRIHGAEALGQDPESTPTEDPAGAVASLLEVLGAVDEHMRHGERGVERQGRAVAARADLLGPDPAGEVHQQAAAVALPVDVARAVEHLLEGGERDVHRVAVGGRVLAHRGIDRARVTVVDARRGDTRTPRALGRVAAGGRASHFHLGPRLLRAGARRVRTERAL
jgi:hypothetical protein